MYIHLGNLNSQELINFILMKSLFVVCITVCFFFTSSNNSLAQAKKFVAPASADAMRNPFGGNTDATAKGKILYANLCVACHGDKGKGDGIASAGLATPPADHTSAKVQAQTDGALFWKIFNGNMPMPAFKSLPQEQVWQLVNYIRTLSKVKK